MSAREGHSLPHEMVAWKAAAEDLAAQRDKLVEALRAARHDLWLYVDADTTSDEEVVRGEVAIRAIDEALAAAVVQS